MPLLSLIFCFNVLVWSLCECFGFKITRSLYCSWKLEWCNFKFIDEKILTIFNVVTLALPVYELTQSSISKWPHNFFEMRIRSATNKQNRRMFFSKLQFWIWITLLFSHGFCWKQSALVFSMIDWFGLKVEKHSVMKDLSKSIFKLS